ncbi:hypothetical protein DPMN_056695 [Dreissena polymorpha]|uniref:Heat shock protein 70 n=1 Tax=Dreissena polymorpha TaxID=45954 RepID=A0A9D4CUW9_DREPO|nr:hypothetical protein DPMN_056695 [Dreissena polymorpha]
MKYILGGTIDIAVHEVCDGGSIKEIYRPSGGDWGGTNVDEAFIKFLREIAGNDAIQRFKDENVEEYLDLLRDFEAKKRGTDAASKTNIAIKIPPTLFGIVQGMTQMSLQDKLQASSYEKTVTLTKTKLRLDADVMRSFVCGNLLQMIQHTSDLLERPECKNVDAILMVGGFSESKFLQEMFKLNFKLPPIVPPKAGLAVLIGAVIYGHRPTAITERKSIYTYGIKSTADYNDKIHPLSKRSVFKDGSVLCVDVFSIIVREGDTLVVGRVHNERSYFPIYESQKVMIIPIFTSRDRNSKFTTDPGCKQVGSLQVPLAGIGTNRSVTVRMLFGGTEIIVECVEEATKRIRRLNIDFLTY